MRSPGVDEPLTRRLAWEACYNARDIGGYATRDGGQTRWRRFLRADNLVRLTTAGIAALIAEGVRTVIDLRSPYELRIDACPFAPPCALPGAPEYQNLPALDRDDKSLTGLLDAATSVSQMYALMLDHCRSQLATIFTAVATAPPGGVLVYCHAGKDRTGVVAALTLALAGVPDATIGEDYALSERHLQPLYDEQLRSARDSAQRERLSQQFRSPLNVALSEAMLETLTYLNTQHGGAHAYLRTSGVAALDLEQVRARLLDA